MADDQISFKLGKYSVHVEYSHAPGTEPEVDAIWFEPPLEAEDIAWGREVSFYTKEEWLNKALLQCYNTVKVEGVLLREEIEQRL